MTKIFRWKGIIPFAIIVTLIYVAAVYYVDGWLQRTLSKQLTKVNGARVEMNGLNLSFKKSALVINGLVFTDPNNLLRNRVDIGKMTFDFQFVPLLKKKFIIDEVGVDQVRWGTARKREGKIPAAWLREWQEPSDSAVGKFVSEAVDHLKDQVVDRLPEIDLDEIGERFDPRKFVVLDKLQTYQSLEKLPGEVKQLGSGLQQDLSAFGKNEVNEIKAIRDQLSSLNPQTIKTPQQAVSAINTVQSLQQSAKDRFDSAKAISGKVKLKISDQVKQVAELKQQFKNDIQAMKDKVSFGDLNLKQLSQSIFGGISIERYRYFLTYYQQARHWMAVLGTPEDEKLPRRSTGRIVPFRITDRTPRFLLSELRLAADTIDNQEVPATYRGQYKLQAKDITSQPKIVGKPMTFSASATLADEKNRHWHKAAFDSSIDRTKEKPIDKFSASLSQLKLAGSTLGKGSVMPIPVSQGALSLSADVIIKDKDLDAAVKGDFRSLSYDFASVKTKHSFQRIVQEIIQEISAFDLQLGLSGELKKPKLRISSTFDNALKDGIMRLAGKKIAAARAKIEAYLRKELESRLSQLESEIASRRKQLEAEADKLVAQGKNIQEEVNRRLTELKDRQMHLVKAEADKLKSRAKEEAGKEIKKLDKPLGGLKDKLGF